MTIQWLLAAVHLLGLGIGLGSVFSRGYELQRINEPGALRRALLADSLWGLSAVLWIVTGLLRAFAGFEKGTAYYMHNTLFWVKMGLLLLILVLEVRPIVRLVTWRLQLRDGNEPDLSSAAGMAVTSYIQTVTIVAMVVLATGMARGIGFQVP